MAAAQVNHCEFSPCLRCGFPHAFFSANVPLLRAERERDCSDHAQVMIAKNKTRPRGYRKQLFDQFPTRAGRLIRADRQPPLFGLIKYFSPDTRLPKMAM